MHKWSPAKDKNQNLKRFEHVFSLILTQFIPELLRKIVEKIDTRYQLKITRAVRTFNPQTSESCLLIDQVSQHASIISSKSSVNLFIDTRSIIEKMT